MNQMMASERVNAAPVFQRKLLQQIPMERMIRLASGGLNLFFAVMRGLAPLTLHIPWIRNGRVILVAVITRAENVRDVLNNNEVFQVPYGPKLQNTSKSEFLLGRDDRYKHQADLKIATRAFPLSDIRAVAKFAAESAEARLDGRLDGIDVIGELARPVLTDICRHYLGVSTVDEDFPFWAMAVSAYLIEPFGTKNVGATQQAEAGASRVIEAIRCAKRNPPAASVPCFQEKTVLRRLTDLQQTSAGPDDQTIEALLCGVIAAIIPTGVLAVGHIIDMLLRHPDMMKAAQHAAASGDPELLRRCLFEALRFNPIIPVWPRECTRDFQLMVNETRSRRIRAGTRVLVSTQSAMRDPRQVRHPRRFDPERPASDYIHFGSGLHACLGAAIASAVIPAILRPLLLRGTISPGAGPRTFFAVVFPDRFPVTLQG
jgi:cytochrome P450